MLPLAPRGQGARVCLFIKGHTPPLLRAVHAHDCGRGGQVVACGALVVSRPICPRIRVVVPSLGPGAACLFWLCLGAWTRAACATRPCCLGRAMVGLMMTRRACLIGAHAAKGLPEASSSPSASTFLALISHADRTLLHPLPLTRPPTHPTTSAQAGRQTRQRAAGIRGQAKLHGLVVCESRLRASPTPLLTAATEAKRKPPPHPKALERA